jgi:hypothetical protein
MVKRNNGNATILVLLLLFLISMTSLLLLQQYNNYSVFQTKNFNELAYYSAYSGIVFMYSFDTIEEMKNISFNTKHYLDNKKNQYFQVRYIENTNIIESYGYYKSGKYVLSYNLTNGEIKKIN